LRNDGEGPEHSAGGGIETGYHKAASSFGARGADEQHPVPNHWSGRYGGRFAVRFGQLRGPDLLAVAGIVRDHAAIAKTAEHPSFGKRRAA
jgi:hypothetical protein